MAPNATPPWRLIEAPIDSEGAATTPATTTPDRPGRPDAALVGTAAVIAVAVALAVVAFILAFTSGSGHGVVIDGSAPAEFLASASPGELAGGEPGSGLLVVEVAGAVAHPGVFRLPTGSRIADLIGAAGGYGPRVDTTRVGQELNLAARVQDGDRVHVPSRDEVVTSTDAAEGGAGSGGSGGGTGSGGSSGGLVDLNRATADALDELPGIGPVTAQKILAAREEALFVSVDDLRSRGIVGEKTFQRIRDLVAVP